MTVVSAFQSHCCPFARMSGSLYLLGIDVRIRKCWENASELPERDWCFIINVWIVNESMWEITILVTFKKWFLFYSLLNIRKQSCKISLYDLYKRGMKKSSVFNSWDGKASEKCFQRIVLLWFCEIKWERKAKETTSIPQLVDNLMNQKPFSF